MRWLAPLAVLLLFSTGCGHTEAAGRRVIVLGVDGMDPQFLEAHWDALPNLARLRREGDFRPLATSIPPQSPVAWSSFITGLDPGGHGIFDFIHRNPATRMPFSSMAETLGPSHTVTLGPYEIPLSGGGVRSLRKGTPFWRTLSAHGVRTSVIRMPVNFPPAECHLGESLSGMGTPDMQGSFGTFTFFTDDPAEARKQVPGGRIEHVKLEGSRVVLRIPGPANGLRRDRAPTWAELTLEADPSAPAARLTADGEISVLRQGEWSGWLRATFPLIPGISSASGIYRVYLQQVHPRLRVYVSPVNIDPAHPDLPISSPASFSRELAERLGPFYTQGIAEESSALRSGLLSRSEFLTQSHKVLDDSLRMFHYELARFDDGLLFYYFSSVDQNSHMLWGKFEPDLLEIYKGIDGAVGDAMRKAGSDATLIVMSDHGFASFDRSVHLNAWLMREGLLTLQDPAKTGDEELFRYVDWGRTQAYALGLNGIYLNLAGREPDGTVSQAERREVVERIAGKLRQFTDPKTGERVVQTVYLPGTAYRGTNVSFAPDLVVGFRRGYRASWQTALGAVPAVTIEDNTSSWIGDHCMAAETVPGVFLSNRKSRSDEPRLFDLTATILREFGVAPTEGMIGRPVF
ncbi:MAG TPA: alkaline phosphatase family protein [Bryobacteraceae bacterium]